MNLVAFRTQVQKYRKLSGHSQQELAQALNLHLSVLSRKLSTTNNLGCLTHPEIKQIIKTLAEWRALTNQKQVLELLELGGLETDSFSRQDWLQSPLNRLAITTLTPSASVRLAKEGLAVSNLPTPLTSLIGREWENEQIGKLLARSQTRLITLLGPGGVGKTRLAIEAVTKNSQQFVDGVFFVDLASISDPALVLPTVVQMLSVPEVKNKAIENSLRDYLRDKNLLLVLDNFEQVVAAAPVVKQWLGYAPGLKVLVTARIALNIQGEHQFLVSPLSLPDTTNLPSHPADLLQYSAVALLVERAQQYLLDFTLTPENIEAIAQICVLLDGLPLALELAAARLKIMSPPTLLQRLEEHRLNFLEGGVLDLHHRQSTLRTTIDWSYSLLTAPEQLLFQRLSVFRGSWTLEAAEQICLDKTDNLINDAVYITADDVLELLTKLIDKSLVATNLSATYAQSEARYNLLETIREYGQEKYANDTDQQTCYAIAQRHLIYYTQLTAHLAPDLTGAKAKNCLTQLEAEHFNLQTALNWSLSALPGEAEQHRNQIEAGFQLGISLYRFWLFRSYFSEGLAIYGKLQSLAINLGITNSVGYAWLLCVYGDLTQSQGNYEHSYVLLNQSLALSRRFDLTSGIAESLLNLGKLFYFQGDFTQAETRLQESLALYREIGDKFGMATSIINLAKVAHVFSRNSQASSYLKESQIYFDELGDKRGLADVWNNLGVIANEQDDYATALRYHQASLEYRREIGDKQQIAISFNNLGIVAKRQGEYQKAVNYYLESLTIKREIGDRNLTASTMYNLGALATGQGDYATALNYLQRCSDLYHELGNKRGLANTLNSLGDVFFMQGDYPTALYYYQENLPLCQEINTKDYLATCLGSLGDVALFQNDFQGAMGYYQQSIRLWNEVENKSGVVANIAALCNLAAKLSQTSAELQNDLAMAATTLAGLTHNTLTLTTGAMNVFVRRLQEQCLGITRQNLDEATFSRAFQQGATTSLDTALDLILATKWNINLPASFTALRLDWEAATKLNIENDNNFQQTPLI